MRIFSELSMLIFPTFLHNKFNFYIFPYPLKLLFKNFPSSVVFCALHSGFTVGYTMYLANQKYAIVIQKAHACV